MLSLTAFIIVFTALLNAMYLIITFNNIVHSGNSVVNSWLIFSNYWGQTQDILVYFRKSARLRSISYSFSGIRGVDAPSGFFLGKDRGSLSPV